MTEVSDVEKEERRLLEAMSSMSSSIKQLNEVLSKVNQQSDELSKDLGTAERQMSALYLPFQSAIYSIQSHRASLRAEEDNASPLH